MNYLVTGGSGFIGSHLTEQLLKKGHSVINVDNFDDFYNYRIKIQNTLEAILYFSAFEYSDKEQDINKLLFLSKSEHYRFYYQDIRDRNGLKEIFKAHQIDAVSIWQRLPECVLPSKGLWNMKK